MNNLNDVIKIEVKQDDKYWVLTLKFSDFKCIGLRNNYKNKNEFYSYSKEKILKELNKVIGYINKKKNL